MPAFKNKVDLGPGYSHAFILIFAALTLSGCGQEPEASVAPVQSEPVPADEPSPPDEPSAPEEESPQVSGPAFWEAAVKGQTQTVRQAIAAGLDVNITDADGRTALLLAAFDGHTEIVQLLLNNGARVNHRDAAGRTALLYASTAANEKTVRLLLEAGAQPDLADRGEGFTALMHAAAEGQLDVVKTLLEYKADRTLRDVDGDTARDFAMQNGHTEVARLLNTAAGPQPK